MTTTKRVRFAEGTSVPVERSRAEIETILMRYGASDFARHSNSRLERIGFRVHDRNVLFELTLPDAQADEFWLPKGREKGGAWYSRSGRGARFWRSPSRAREAWEAEVRRLWRSLAMAIKSKLEVVESGIAEFETEFLGHIVMPGTGRTVADLVRPAIEESYQSGRIVPLLAEKNE